MDHRAHREDTDPSPPAAQEAVAAASVNPSRVRLATFMFAAQRAAREYVSALAALHLAATLADDLRATGVDVGADAFGSAAALAEQFKRVALAAVKGGLIEPNDPIVLDSPIING